MRGQSWRLRNFFTEIYGVRVGDKVILFDAGVGTEGRALDALLGALNARRDDVSQVFLTHGHFDHVAASPVSVDWQTADGTATAGSDYRAASATLTIPAGSRHAYARVRVVGDTRVEPDETFTVTLSSPVGATVAVPMATGTIVNDD